MNHLSVNVLLVLTFIFSQVNSGIIFGKISEAVGHIKCKAHNIGNNIFQHVHQQHDPCAPTEHFHPEGQVDPHQGHHRHDHDHSGQWGHQFQGQNHHGHDHPEDHQPHGPHDHYDPNQSHSSRGDGKDGQFHGEEKDAQSDPTTEKQLDDGNKDEIVSETTALTPREESDTTPLVDVRLGTGDEVQTSTASQQNGRRVLGDIKSNCPSGYIADTKGICREVY